MQITKDALFDALMRESAKAIAINMGIENKERDASKNELIYQSGRVSMLKEIIEKIMEE